MIITMTAIDWQDFVHSEEAKTCVGIGNAFRKWLRLKCFGKWIDESDKDFAERDPNKKIWNGRSKEEDGK